MPPCHALLYDSARSLFYHLMPWLLLSRDLYCHELLVCATQLSSFQVRTIVGRACAGNAGNIFPATDFQGSHLLAIPACIKARASRTCRDACRVRQPAVAGKTFPASPAHAQPTILRIWYGAHGKSSRSAEIFITDCSGSCVNMVKDNFLCHRWREVCQNIPFSVLLYNSAWRSVAPRYLQTYWAASHAQDSAYGTLLLAACV